MGDYTNSRVQNVGMSTYPNDTVTSCKDSSSFNSLSCKSIQIVSSKEVPTLDISASFVHLAHQIFFMLP